MGLVTAAVPEADLDAELGRVLEALTKGNPQGLRETKQLLGRPLVERIDRHGAELSKLSARLFGSQEAKDAMLAFLSRKK
jgi:enoyl-CoA hydratase/methylglutaconyl-CoA hydratase